MGKKIGLTILQTKLHFILPDSRKFLDINLNKMLDRALSIDQNA